MKKYALIGVGTSNSNTIDSFEYDNIDKIVIYNDEGCLKSTKVLLPTFCKKFPTLKFLFANL